MKRPTHTRRKKKKNRQMIPEPQNDVNPRENERSQRRWTPSYSRVEVSDIPPLAEGIGEMIARVAPFGAVCGFIFGVYRGFSVNAIDGLIYGLLATVAVTLGIVAVVRWYQSFAAMAEFPKYHYIVSLAALALAIWGTRYYTEYVAYPLLTKVMQWLDRLAEHYEDYSNGIPGYSFNMIYGICLFCVIVSWCFTAAYASMIRLWPFLAVGYALIPLLGLFCLFLVVLLALILIGIFIYAVIKAILEMFPPEEWKGDDW